MVKGSEGRMAVEAWLTRVKPELQPIAYRLDELIMEAMPDAVCAIKWNVPFYGLKGQGWITALNSFKAHVKSLNFFDGSALKPMLPSGRTTPTSTTAHWKETRREAGEGVVEAGEEVAGLVEGGVADVIGDHEGRDPVK